MAPVSGPRPSPAAPRTRITARVLLLDREDRILLMNGRLPGAPAGAWFTLGGGVETGETPRQAAAREIREETGFADAQIGAALWVGELDIHDRAGPIRVTEHFFLARCAGGEPSRAGWDAAERALIDDIRWWTLADLRACGEPIFPADLTRRLGRILAEPNFAR